MLIRTCIFTVLLLLQPIAALMPSFFTGLARAEGENPATPAARPEAPLIQQDGDSQQAPAPPLASEATATSQKTPGAIPGFVDTLHGRISRSILSTADWLDSFFADPRMLKEENHSYVRFRYDVFLEEKSDNLYQPSFDVRLVLPQLRKKTHLVLSADPAETSRSAPAAAGTSGARIGPAEERNVSAALHYFFRSTAEESIVARAGAQLSNGTPVLFVAPRYRAFMPLQEWGFRFTQEAVYRTDTGWKTETGVDFERTVFKDFFFRTGVDGLWMANTNGYFYSLGCTLRQPLGPTKALQYEWSNSYQTRPVHELMDVVFKIRYRQSFLREWLFFELAPQCRYPRDRNFDVTPGILFRFEMFFGKKD